MEKAITFVGMDTSKAAIKVAILFPGQEVAVERSLANEGSAVRRMVRQVQREAPDEVAFCYEAGVGGYALKRQIERNCDIQITVARTEIGGYCPDCRSRS